MSIETGIRIIGGNWVNDPESLKYIKTPEHQAKITASLKRYFIKNPQARAKENNPRWLGGITPESRRRLSKVSWKKIKTKVIKRDNSRCINCGNNNNLHVHHIISWRNNGTDTMDNLQTLCNHCHMRLEKLTKGGGR